MLKCTGFGHGANMIIMILFGLLNYYMHDLFIDEEKQDGFIGFLLVQNTPALQQFLYRRRELLENYNGEIKYVRVNNTTIRIILSWLSIFFSNDFCVDFYYRKWNGKINNKRNVVTKMIMDIKGSYNIKRNLVAFMDSDSNHSTFNLQNQVRQNTKIARCYHLDSKCFDMLQLCDLLLQCSIKMDKWEYDRHEYNKLIRKMDDGQSMKKPELKKLIVFHAIRLNRRNRKIRKQVVKK